ncbi:hypothetical protein JCM6882_003749 [Rhodosporidiobolus microsporus]
MAASSLANNPSLRTRSFSPAARGRVVRSASASSAAGNAAFAATLPPAPERGSRMRVGGGGEREVEEQDKRGLLATSSPPPAATSPLAAARLLLRRARRTPRLSLALLSLTLSLFFLLSRLALPTLDLLHMWHYKLLDRAYDARWGWPLAPPCSLRKRPVIFVRGEDRVAVVWETNECGEEVQWGMKWRRESKAGGGKAEFAWRGVSPVDDFTLRDEEGGDERVVYTGAIEGLFGSQTYEYEVSSCSALMASCTAVARGTFPWLGRPTLPHQPAPTPSTTLHIACIADNQFNLRVFRRVLLRLRSFARSVLPSDYFFNSPPAFTPHEPHLVLHAGDAVQNPHNLAQWQTDFWDPLTRTFSASASLFASLFSSAPSTSTLPPVLLARGNHDWDLSGQNLYTGGLASQSPLRANYAAYLSSLSPPQAPPDDYHSHRATYYSHSPHARFRLLVLDSNLPTVAEQDAQERWLLWELGREEWRAASVRAVVVHTAPWIEWWDREAWTGGGESEWSAYVRRSLMPLLAQHGCTLVLSGHSHAYTRGFLPYSLVPSFSAALNSSSLPRLVSSAARSRPWEKDGDPSIDEPGMLLVTFGGAGGTLDSDRVEEWGFMDRSVSGRYHFGWLAASFAGSLDGGESRAVEGLERAMGRRRARGEGPTVYRVKGLEECTRERKVRDVVEWRAVGVEGKEVDRVWLVAEGCGEG